jgi:hypothetical protein
MDEKKRHLPMFLAGAATHKIPAAKNSAVMPQFWDITHAKING